MFVCVSCLPLDGCEFGDHFNFSYGPCEVCRHTRACADCHHGRRHVEASGSARPLGLNDHCKEKESTEPPRDAAPPSGTQGWQPIESAPKDGTHVLLWVQRGDVGSVTRGRWDPDQYVKRPRPYWSTADEQLWGTRDARMNPPTHWMPLPAPPAALASPAPSEEETKTKT